MIPESLIQFSAIDGKIYPHYFTCKDSPWLRLLLEEFKDYEGKKRRDINLQLKSPRTYEAPRGKRRLAEHILLKNLTNDSSGAAISPRELRSFLFLQGCRNFRLDRAEILKLAQTEFNLDADQIEQNLFADLPSERQTEKLPDHLTPEELTNKANLALIQGLLFRSTRLSVVPYGGTRAVIRHAKLRGLICVPECIRTNEIKIHLSGPYSLFRKTLIYGRALAQLVPILAWCNRFQLQAECVIRHERFKLELDSSAPIRPSKMPRLFDSKLEEKFARDFGRATNDWVLVREPRPISCERTFIFPDFEIVPQSGTGKRWLLEIVGFWTPTYLEKKMERLRKANIDNLILCVNEKHACTDEQLPKNALVIPFKTRIKAQQVLEAITE